MIFLLGKYLSRRRRFIPKVWEIVDSIQIEIPKRPSNLPHEKNNEGIYLDRIPIIEDTVAKKYFDTMSQSEGRHIARVAGMATGFLPLHTTVHNIEEHYLTTISLSFHQVGQIYFLDVASMDPEFLLDTTNIFSVLFANGKEECFSFDGALRHDDAVSFSSIVLSYQQMQYFANEKIDKWSLERNSDQLIAVASLNFEIRKYIYKPELQYTIQCMARTLLSP